MHYQRDRAMGLFEPIAPRSCSTPSCERKHYGMGFCKRHYNRSRSPNPRPTVEQRFWRRVEKTENCWNWTGQKFWAGYGRFNTEFHKGLPTKTWYVHRYAYELLIGPIPDEMQIDHRCFNKACVNPDHLRAVTQKQNLENHNGANANSVSGVRGVHQVSNGKWKAQVANNGTKYYLGRFELLEDAEAACIAKRNELHTHNDVDRGKSVA